MSEYKSVLISGAGELGARYLQSMVSCTLPFIGYVHNNDQDALKICRQRWEEANGEASPHRLIMCNDLSSLPDQLDLVIVTSTAASRPLLVGAIANRTKVRYWILEKILAQSVQGIGQMLDDVGKHGKSWVNYYMLGEAWYAEIKKHLVLGTPKKMNVHGGDWGLVCNSLHFIHLYAWFSGSHLVSLDTGALSGEWHESKRPGNWELFGELTARFSDGGQLDLVAEPGPVKYSLSFQDGRHMWQIDEPNGVARRSDGFEVRGRVPYQSERKLVEDILSGKGCRLPTFAAVAATDELFVSAMLTHWRQHMNGADQLVPIT